MGKQHCWQLEKQVQFQLRLLLKMKKWSSQWTQFMQLRKAAWKKNQDFNGIWTHDLAIIGAMLYQLSYEAADVGCRSIVGSYVPVKEMSVNDIRNKSYMNCRNEMKMKKWSSQWTQFMLLRLLDKDLVGRILHEKIVPQEMSGQYLRYKWPGLGWIHRIKGLELTCPI